MKGKVYAMESKTKKKFNWNKRLGKSDKGTSDYVNPGLIWSAIICEVTLIALITLIVTM